ncbi:unnamed protein product [Auanema sp. JU1783]|nr:unnamed protein product [Auanema sp. JU1783]
MLCGCLSPRAPPSFETEKMLGSSNRTNEPQSFLNKTDKSSPADLVDLEDIVISWAKFIFNATKSRTDAKIKSKYLCYNINWTKLMQESKEPQYNEKGPQVTEGPKSETVLFKTTFSNTTQREQEYSFKTERCTRSASTVIIEKGVCRGAEVNLKLQTPCEIVEANAGFHHEIMLNHIGENTQEEELTWGVDSSVKVPGNTETVAELVIMEEEHKKSFTIENRLSGKVVVTVTNLKENNSLVTVLEGNIADILRRLPDYSAKGFSFEGNVAKFETKGVCIFRYGIEQKVRINETPL